MKIFKKYAPYAAIVLMAFVGILCGSWSVKAGLVAEHEKATGNLIFAQKDLYSVALTPKNGQTIDEVIADFSSYASFKGVYAGIPSASGFAEIGKKRFGTIICFESDNAPSVTAEFVKNGRGLTLSDKADGKKVNVVLGGKNWEKYAVGSTFETTLFSGDNALGIEATVVGKMDTPFVSRLLNNTTDIYETYGGVIILPGDLIKELVPNAFEKYVVAFADFEDYKSVFSTIDSSLKYEKAEYYQYPSDDKRPGYSKNFYLYGSIIISAVCGLLLLSANGKKRIVCAVCYGILGAGTTLISALVFKNSVSSWWYAGRTFDFAVPIAAVIVCVAAVFTAIGAVEMRRRKLHETASPAFDLTKPTD